MLKNKKYLIGILLFLCCIFVFFVWRTKTNTKKDDVQSENHTQTEEESNHEADTGSELMTESDTSDEKSNAPDKKSANNSNENNGQNDSVSQSTNSGLKEENEEKKEKSEETQSKDTISFPYTIPDTKIKLTYMNGYDGLFIEDGSDKKVKNVAALQIENNSEQAVEYGEVKLKAGSKILEFDFSDLSEESSIIVLEKSRTKYSSKWEIEYVDNTFAYMDSFSLLETDVELDVNGNNGIVVKNITDEKIPLLRIFYKYQMSSGEYIGGITYTAKVSNLKAGESKTIYPSHFATDGSIVMMVRRYDSTAD